MAIEKQAWLSFALGDELYCVPVKQVRDIIKDVKPEPVPGSPTAVDGVINSRGDIMTVINGRRMLHLSPRTADQHLDHIITLELADETLGLVIDQPGDIVDFSESEVESALEGDELISGTVKIEDNLLIVLNIEKLPVAVG